ncbi:MAG: type IX secretion system sortase PorU [Bacteroidota bacterium]
MRIFTYLLLFFGSLNLWGQRPITLQKQLDWLPEPIIHNPTGNFERKIWTFKNSNSHPKHPSLPVFSERFRLPVNGQISVNVNNARYEPLEKTDALDDAFLSESLQIGTTVELDRNQHYGKVFFIPIIKDGQGYQKLVDFELVVNFTPTTNTNAVARNNTNTFNSVLKDGAIYKIAVSERGMQRLDYAFLKDVLEIDIDNVDPTTIKIYGNGGGILPQRIADVRPDDIVENAIQVVGEADGSFDSDDYILFYSEAANKWIYDANEQIFNQQTNIYDRNNYYFLKISPEKGKRITENPSLSSTDYTTRNFTDYARLEEDLVNLLDNFAQGQGTGKDWYGDLFETIRTRTYTDFNFPNIRTDEPANLQAVFAGRSRTTTSFNAVVGPETFSATIRRSNTGDIEDEYAHIGRINTAFNPTDEQVLVEIEYPQTASSTGWLDYIQLNVRRDLIFSGDQMTFRDPKTLTANSSTFQLSGVDNSVQIWDISNPLTPFRQTFDLSGNELRFGANTTTLKEYIAFRENGPFLTPTAIGKVPNQNIHEIEAADLVIVYHQDFEAAALDLAEHRRNQSGFDVKTVLVDHIYNEFSSGKLDPTAIRDFAKMVYERSPNFNYLLLFGDGSFDYKNIKNLPNPSGFIPVYETDESLHPIEGFPTDDYYSLLSDNEGGNLRGALDIAVGRIPTKTPEEAQAVVRKIINYETSPQTLGNWRLNQTFLADDEDGSIHQRQANGISTKVDTVYDVFNVNKIFLDAFQQITTPGGERYPAVKEAINNEIFKGILVFNYLGHGGAKGWTQERVLETNDILSWTNFNRLPLLVTATCSFTGYDDANFVTAGEESILNPNGGAIGLFTTVRAVYSSQNERLTRAVFDQMYEKVDGAYPPIGEIMRRGKNSNSADTTNINSRKFTLIGDPSMRLALPKFDIVTTAINGQPITTDRVDTIQALQKVTVEGFVADAAGNPMSSFNGRVFPIVFDKKTTVSNLGNDRSSRILPFDIQKNVLFKGKASVTNGRFQFTFVVPKDINYNYGFGKISYYAENGSEDAAGYYERIVVGSTKSDAAIDNQGPTVEVFMNDSTFIFGGTTNANPTLLVLLSDDNGINVSGTSIGHDLTAVLDNNTQNTFLLNEFYEAAQDDFRRGIVRFPLSDLPMGTHEIRVRAWDVFNNSAEGITEFVVADDAEAALERVLNYPNPFTTSTQFQFLHNLNPGQPMEVQIRIFTVAGRLVKTIDTDVISDGNRVSNIAWDGKDEYGGQLARGTYLYKVSVRSSAGGNGNQTVDSDFEKLVILK